MHELKGKNPIELSTLGDPFVNLIYSLALSKAFQRPKGRKVSNNVLAEALVQSGIREKVGSRNKRETLGDFAEGFIFSAYAEDKMTIEEAVNILSDNLSPSNTETKLREESIKAFADLLMHVALLCQT